MSATNSMETAILQLYFNNTDHANIGDAGGLQNSATAGSFYISLHTADPGETGSQTTSEANYTGYARVAVARSGAGWTISTVTYFGIGSDASGAGNLFFKGALSASLAVSAGITPSFAIGELDVNLD